jgi:hypothetical protein
MNICQDGLGDKMKKKQKYQDLKYKHLTVNFEGHEKLFDKIILEAQALHMTVAGTVRLIGYEYFSSKRKKEAGK